MANEMIDSAATPNPQPVNAQPTINLDGPILVLIRVNDRQKSLLESHLPAGQEICYRPVDSVSQAEVEAAAMILGNPPPAWLKSCTRLKLLHLNSSGAEQYLEAGVLPTGTILCNAAGAYGLAISEHMLGMLLSLMKKLHIYRDNQRSVVWQSSGHVTSLWKSRVLVIGLGDIGGEFARRAKAFGAYTIGIRRQTVERPDWLDELHTPDDLDQLLPTVDVVALSVPGSPETQRLLSVERIRSLKPGTFILNIGRGSAIDTEALIEALRSGQVAGAGLDVNDPEPLPPDHPLWREQNALITPHVSGGFYLRETKERVINIWAENLARLFQGQDLRNVLRQ